MRIFIDIGHPAHVHYFKNFISIMKEKGYEFYITARNRKHVFDLLKRNGLDYYDRGTGSAGAVGKLKYLLKMIFKIHSLSKKFKPDLFLDFGTIYAAPAARLQGKPYIAFEDTENAGLYRALFMPFTSAICTVSAFKKKLGRKQVPFEGYMELCYLHPNYYTPDPSVLDLLGVQKDEKYVIVRFVSWEAAHDVGHQGITAENKIKAVQEFSKHARVFISSEGDLPEKLKQYEIQIPSERMHDALSYATLLFGESSTMASECACLGTPAIFLDNEGRGYTDEEEERYDLVFNFTESLDDQEKSIAKGMELLTTDGIKKEWKEKQQKMLSEKIDTTAFMVWFIENYPKSMDIPFPGKNS
ncbi:MAG: DUF354 domain-containing protein [bacterium]|nr:DUF354 domain-containing protein [bacterium]